MSKFAKSKVDGEVERWSLVVTRDGEDTVWWQGIVKDKVLSENRINELVNRLHDFWTAERSRR